MVRYKSMSIVFSLLLAAGLSVVSSAAGDRTVTDSSGNAVIENVKPSDIPRLVTLLGHGDNNVAAGSEELLVEFGEDAVPALIEGLGMDDTDKPRIMAVLTAIGDARAVAPVSSFLTDKDRDISGAARGSLVGFGEAASHHMVGLLRDEELRNAAADVLINIKPSRDAVYLARELLGDEVPATRAAAAYVLGLWDDVDSFDTIKRLVSDGDPLVRSKALNAYGRLAEKAGGYDRKMLLGLLDDESAAVRVSAVRLLSVTPGEDMVGPLTRLALSDPDGEVRDNALSALGATGDPKVATVLIKGLGDSNENAVISSLWYLDDLGAKEAVPHIMALFEGGKPLSNELMVEEACRALAGLKEPVDLGVFLPYLDTSRAYDTRMAVLDLVGALGEPGDSSLIASLEGYKVRENSSGILRRYDAVLQGLK